MGAIVICEKPSQAADVRRAVGEISSAVLAYEATCCGWLSWPRSIPTGNARATSYSKPEVFYPGRPDESGGKLKRLAALKTAIEVTIATERSQDPAFAEKLEDIVGLYMNPPAHAVVLSIDEKSQIQALDRTQPGPSLKSGRCATMTHDYKRNGTTTLFAALNILDGTVIGRCMQRHRHQELIRFLNPVEQAIPRGKAIHAVLDNYAAHKQPRVIEWLKRHPRWVSHFTPTSGSWLNAVESFFSALTRRRIRRGTFHSVADLQAAINRYIDQHNDDPKPFVWTKPAKTILEKTNQMPVPSV